MSTHLRIGVLGEKIACKFLRRKGFRILETNINRKWGELDIVVQHSKTKRVHIVEVKTVSRSKKTSPIHPTENLTRHKLEKLQRTCLLYVQEKQIQDWQLDAVLVWLYKENKDAQVQLIENISDK